MNNYKNLLWLLLFGSLWGMSELVGGGILYNSEAAYASVGLAAFALFILAIARAIWNKPGTSTAIGAIAAVFKLVHTQPYICHLLGIVILGIAFDIAATLLMKHEKRISYRSVLAGIVSSYGGYALFALIITYIIRYEFWAAEGLPKVLNHIFVSGSFAALASLVVVPLGYWIGLNARTLVQQSPRWVFRGSVLVAIVLWALGGFVR